MQQLISFGVGGIPYGCTYAIVAVGLVLTYQTTGVFNFAFGAQAYTSGFVFTWLVQTQDLPVWLAFLLAVVVLAPGLGVLLDRFLFSRIPNTNTTAKLVTGIALLVGIPSLLPVIFGNENLFNVPSVIFNIDTVYTHIAGQPINGIDVSSVLFTAIALTALVLLMRFTSLGLQMRRRGESALSRARRGECPRGRAHIGLGYLWPTGRSRRRLACPAVFPTSGPGLHHLDGGCHRRGVGGAALHADRRRSWDLDGDP